jgi:hypothetical protein
MNSPANDAGSLSMPGERRWPSSAQAPARKPTSGKHAIISPIAGNAHGAERTLWRTVTVRRHVVPRSVETESVPPTAVYNLTLQHHNAYYADGILVFNSFDALALTLAEQGLMVTSEEMSGLFDPNPLMDPIPGMEW